MIEQFTAFRASDNTVHDSPWAAWKRELHLWLRSHGVENDAIAAAIVKHVADGQPDTLKSLSQIVGGLMDAAPEPPPKPAEAHPDNADLASFRETQLAEEPIA